MMAAVDVDTAVCVVDGADERKTDKTTDHVEIELKLSSHAVSMKQQAITSEVDPKKVAANEINDTVCDNKTKGHGDQKSKELTAVDGCTYVEPSENSLSDDGDWNKKEKKQSGSMAKSGKIELKGSGRGTSSLTATLRGDDTSRMSLRTDNSKTTQRNDVSKDDEHSPKASNSATGVASGKAATNTKMFDGKNFVEAPIPKTNPWGKKVVVAGGETNAETQNPATLSQAAGKGSAADTNAASAVLKLNDSEAHTSKATIAPSPKSAMTRPVKSEPTKSESATEIKSGRSGTAGPATSTLTLKQESAVSFSKVVQLHTKDDTTKATEQPHRQAWKTAPLQPTSVVASVSQQGESSVVSSTSQSSVELRTLSNIAATKENSDKPKPSLDITINASPDPHPKPIDCSGTNAAEVASQLPGIEASIRGSDGASENSTTTLTQHVSGDGGDAASDKLLVSVDVDPMSAGKSDGKFKWSAFPWNEDISVPKAGSRTSRENEPTNQWKKKTGGDHMKGRRSHSQGHGQDLDSSLDWPRLNKPETEASEKDSVSSSRSTTAASAEVSGSKTQIKSMQVTHDAGCMLSPASNNAPPSSESGGDDSSVKEQSKGTKKKVPKQKWKQMPIELPKTERQRPPKLMNSEHSSGESRRDRDDRRTTGDTRGDRETRGGVRDRRGRGDRDTRIRTGDSRGEARDDTRPAEARGDTRGGSRGEGRSHRLGGAESEDGPDNLGDRSSRGGGWEQRGGRRGGSGGAEYRGANREAGRGGRGSRREESDRREIGDQDRANANIQRRGLAERPERLSTSTSTWKNGRDRNDRPSNHDSAGGESEASAPSPRRNQTARSDAKNWREVPPSQAEESDLQGSVVGVTGSNSWKSSRNVSERYRINSHRGGQQRGIGRRPMEGMGFIPTATTLQGFYVPQYPSPWLVGGQFCEIPMALPYYVAQAPQQLQQQLQPLSPHRAELALVPLTSPPAVFCDPATLNEQLKIQIEYYFSEANLVHDFYLRRQMDKDGWISVQQIAPFKRVATLGADLAQIVQSVRDSEIVETSADELRMRCRVDPTKWTVNGIDPYQFSSLKPTAVEFVPGQRFTAPATSTSSTASVVKTTINIDQEAQNPSPLADVSTSVAVSLSPPSTTLLSSTPPTTSVSLSDSAAQLIQTPEAAAEDVIPAASCCSESISSDILCPSSLDTVHISTEVQGSSEEQSVCRLITGLKQSNPALIPESKSMQCSVSAELRPETFEPVLASSLSQSMVISSACDGQSSASSVVDDKHD